MTDDENDPGLAEFDLDDAAEWEEFEDEPQRVPMRQRQRRKPGLADLPESVVTGESEGAAGTAAFQTTYKPSRHEEGWLLESLGSFYELNLITDVLAQVKGGKEASVYRCRAHPAMGVEFLAAKVYRPRKFRNLRNDKMYREGRAVLKADGRPVKNSDHRVMRALGKKTEFGRAVQHTSWLMYEYTTLDRLFEAGAAVPRPFGAGENAVLMSYHGDADRAAPTLIEVGLEPEEAAPLFAQVMGNIEVMLQHGLIHGDLSAYNILYWDGEITLIDFPQVVDAASNRNAPSLLQRDIARVCEYFARYGVASDPEAILNDLWSRYGQESLDDLMLETA